MNYHQFLLAEWSDAPPTPPADRPANGLITPDPPWGAVIYTGIATGAVAVSVELRRQAPPPGAPSWDEWEEVAEVTVEAPVGQLRVYALMEDPPDLPPLTIAGPGTYRVRVHARGRDIAYDLSLVDEIVEDYLIQVWPGPPGPEVIHKQADV
ncbi:hypothetical protein [Actinomadura miaoliensis]|uniref:hypothetical protein n=1 Tax=Actinomadura miaoliensis TaxID=430685 RepID=UPI0031E70B9A